MVYPTGEEVPVLEVADMGKIMVAVVWRQEIRLVDDLIALPIDL